MARVRLAAYAALLLVLLLGAAALAAAPAPGRCRWGPRRRSGGRRPSGLLVAEVVTGGASASDEYVELANAGHGARRPRRPRGRLRHQLGATVTRKATWTASTVLASGPAPAARQRRGVYAGRSPTRPTRADSPRRAGRSCSGRSAGRPSMPSGWGDAANAFVEGVAAPAPAAGTVDRAAARRALGNSQDTNDNATDFVAERGAGCAGARLGSAPRSCPRRRSRQRTPAPTPTASPAPTPTASPRPDADRKPTPTPTPTPPPSRPARRRPRRPAPDADRDAPPRRRRRRPAPTPTASPASTPTATPVADARRRHRLAQPIPDLDRTAAARRRRRDPGGRPDDGPRHARVGRTGFRPGRDRRHRGLPRRSAAGRPRPGRASGSSGTLDTRYAQRTLRVAGRGHRADRRRHAARRLSPSPRARRARLSKGCGSRSPGP